MVTDKYCVLLLALIIAKELTREKCLTVSSYCHSPCPIFSDTLYMRISELPQFWNCLFRDPIVGMHIQDVV